ncbi:MAG: hypothetical protein IRY95_07440, partial [Clostridia bacterium]|nr:hypothetical protein [Clostridia bacterium]
MAVDVGARVVRAAAPLWRWLDELARLPWPALRGQVMGGAAAWRTMAWIRRDLEQALVFLTAETAAEEGRLRLDLPGGRVEVASRRGARPDWRVEPSTAAVAPSAPADATPTAGDGWRLESGEHSYPLTFEGGVVGCLTLRGAVTTAGARVVASLLSLRLERALTPWRSRWSDGIQGLSLRFARGEVRGVSPLAATFVDLVLRLPGVDAAGVYEATGGSADGGGIGRGVVDGAGDDPNWRCLASGGLPGGLAEDPRLVPPGAARGLLFVGDCLHDGRWSLPAELTIQAGVRSAAFAAAPVAGGRTALLALFSRLPYGVTLPFHPRFLRVMSRLLAAGLSLARSRGAERRSRGRFWAVVKASRDVLAHLPEGVVVV